MPEQGDWPLRAAGANFGLAAACGQSPAGEARRFARGLLGRATVYKITVRLIVRIVTQQK